MRTLILRLIILVFCLFSVGPFFAQDVKSIEKQNKELIKSFKKKYKYIVKDVEVIVENDGFWYFLLIGKDKTFGVANQDGKIIIPMGNNSIDYYPAEKEGIVKTAMKDVYGTKMAFAYAFEATQPSFLVHNENYRIISTDGNVLFDKINRIRKTQGYWVISTSDENIKSDHDINANSTFTFRGRNIGLINSKGDLLVKPEYRTITLGCAYQSTEEAKLSELNNLRLCCFEKENEDNVSVKGAITLDGTLPPLPCIFNNITIRNKYTSDAGIKKVWMVMKTALSDYEEYTGNSLSNKYRDEGEKLFEQGKYGEVVEFYSKEGILQPWSKFYTGASLLHVGLSNTSGAKLQAESIENNNWGVYNLLDKNGSTFDLDLAKKQFETAIELLQAYLKEDNTFKSQAELHISMCNNYINDIPSLWQRYQNAMLKLGKKKQDDIRRQREAALQAKQRKTELMYGILSIFANALLKSGSITTSVRTPNTYGGSSVGVGTGTTSSGSDNSSKIAEWENKKADALRRRGDYEDKLRKEPNSSYYKQMVRDMNDMIKLCDDQIQFLRTH